MTKDEILSDIRRTAKENGNVPLGERQFKSIVGIQTRDWRGKYWARWGDAIREAGLTPNSLKAAFDEAALLEGYISLSREFGRLPTMPEIQLKKRRDPNFPAWDVFYARFGTKPRVIARVAEYCKGKEDYIDIPHLL